MRGDTCMGAAKEYAAMKAVFSLGALALGLCIAVGVGDAAAADARPDEVALPEGYSADPVAALAVLERSLERYRAAQSLRFVMRIREDELSWQHGLKQPQYKRLDERDLLVASQRPGRWSERNDYLQTYIDGDRVTRVWVSEHQYQSATINDVNHDHPGL